MYYLTPLVVFFFKLSVKFVYKVNLEITNYSMLVNLCYKDYYILKILFEN